MCEETEKKEFRAQRHDFIKEYYKMAVADLDRHLKGGWQTIVVLAGGAAALSAGHQGGIALPVAISIAVLASMWGALTVLDANYWSLRAIAFLANVEAIYFSKEDQLNFNKYAGLHPPFELLNSLKYLFGLCAVFAILSLTNLLWTVGSYFSTLSQVWNRMLAIHSLHFFVWCLPILIFLWGSVWTFAVLRKTIESYLEFSLSSPGPGLRKMTVGWRHIDQTSASYGLPCEIDQDVQVPMQQSLRRLKAKVDWLWNPVCVVVGLVTVGFIVVCLVKLIYIG